MIMDNLIAIAACGDGSCCCVSLRYTVASISILSMVVSITDLVSSDSVNPCCTMKEYVESTRLVLSSFFLMANVLLFVSSIMETAVLVEIYVWNSLGYILMGLGVAVLDLLFRIKHRGVTVILTFLTEVAFLFVISRCLLLVNTYKNHLDVSP